jgi:protein-S-isoprenylcysteine O-methyltransferase Ste14
VQFSVFHSVFAGESCKRFMQFFMKKKYKYYRVLFSIFAIINFSFIISYHFTIHNTMLWKTSLPEIVIASAGMTTGGFIMAYFTIKFFFDLSGADIFLQTKKSQALIVTSLYRFVRHPLYTATLLFIWSIFFWQPALSNLISCICITIYTIAGIYFEEKKLIKNFGDSYIQYRNRTPMLIPKFY